MKRWLAIPLVCAAAGACSVGAQANRPADGPLSPEQALASFEIEPGYRIEVVAAEPLIQDPVAMAFDERGRLYVVENRGYPGPLEGAPQAAPQGVIARLDDRDGDGRYDSRTDFATGLTYPNGIMPWNDGVFVTAAPDLLYLKDTNGDGVADERRVALTGFSTTRTPQIRFSHPTLGIDNWVYLTSGLNGGRVSAPDYPERPAVEFTTSDSRFNPLTLAFELTGGRSQFGLTFDDYGRRFSCSNRHPVWHIVLEPRYLKRNPHLAFSETVHEVSRVGADATVWPLSADMTTASFIPGLMSTPHAGTFTAASGVHIHRGDALPEDGRGSFFICESAQNLVQRQVRARDGVTFTSRPAQDGREFLATRDTWFRPVFATNGPDGALYIVDMYRRFIDHPQYVPEPGRSRLDFESGKDRGRIYRVVASGWKRAGAPIDLSRMSAIELAETLEHRNAWWRETAQRLLVERRDRSAAAGLRRLASAGRSETARLHALWTLEGLEALERADILKAVRDAHPAVRENAVRLAEPRLAASPDLLAAVLRLIDDSDARVRFQAALALGGTDDPRTIAALAALARRDGADTWMRAAVLSSVGDRRHAFLRAFVASPGASSRAKAAVMQDLGQLFGAAETPERCLELIQQFAPSDDALGWQPAALAGLADGLRARKQGDETRSALVMLLASGLPGARAARARAVAIVSHSEALAQDASAPIDSRLTAIALLAHMDHASVGKTLERLVVPQQPSAIQIAAVRALGRLPGRAAVRSLVDGRRWAALTPEVREAVLTALSSDERHLAVLLDAVERGSIPTTAIGSSRRGRLTNHRDASIQSRARAVFARLDAGDRMRVYERLRAAVLERRGDAASGGRLFSAHCASCHTFRGSGGQTGPDLSGIGNQPAEAILLHVIVPDYEITPGYEAYAVETRDGRTIVGRLESEAPNGLTMRDAASQPHAILRSEVASIAAAPQSLMPADLERAMSEQDVADLIAYLKSAGR